MKDKILKDYSGNEIKVGDRVIIGKGKDVCFGKITKCQIPNNWDGSWIWIVIKTEDSNTSIDRRSNQVIKIDENYGR